MRKHLLDKYRPAEAKLTGLRQQVLAEELSAEPPMGFWTTLWQELFLGPKLIWRGMAAVWLVALCLNMASSSSESTMQMAQQPIETTPDVMEVVREQRRMRDELLGIGVASVELSPADRPRDGLKPRSERKEDYAAV
ncbi:MAG TPA: hypothetical protein VGH19_17970 [Verrucomicrobiae bacterium]